MYYLFLIWFFSSTVLSNKLDDCYDSCSIGACINGNCFCQQGWYGVNCSSKTVECGPTCNDHGLCILSGPQAGYCECIEGYCGRDCEFKTGLLGTCYCDPTACKRWNYHHKGCASECYKNGVCLGLLHTPSPGECYCKKGWYGSYCNTTVLKCPTDCYDHGECIQSGPRAGQCVCIDGFIGVDCMTPLGFGPFPCSCQETDPFL